MNTFSDVWQNIDIVLQENETYTQMTRLSVDALNNIKTVTSTCSEGNFLTMIHLDLQTMYSFCLKKMHWRLAQIGRTLTYHTFNIYFRGFFLGFIQALQFFSCSACLTYGGKLLFYESMTLDQLLK